MPSWFRRVAGLEPSKWSDEEDNLGPPLDISVNEKTHDFTKSAMPTPTTSTAVDHILPPPALQTHNSRRIKTKSARLGFGVYWMRLKKQLGAGVAPSNSSLIGDSAADSSYTRRPEPPLDEDGEVNEVVVDRVWTTPSEASSDSDDSPPEGAPPLDKSVLGQSGNTIAGDSSDHESVDHNSFWRRWKLLVVIRYKFYPTLREFFFTRFSDEKSESHYAQEDWILKKSLAIWAALWLIVNWVLGVAFLDGADKASSLAVGDIVFYFVVGPLLAFPVLWMVVYDWPRDRPMLYQLFLVIAIWAWGFYFVLFLKICNYYPPKNNPQGAGACSTRDFLGLFFYTTALQTMGLFGLKLNRLMAAIGAFSFFVMTSSFMIPLKSSWVRNMINSFVFHFFLIYVHYMRENSERRLYTLRYQLKVQYKATQKAQVNERQTADSKRRLTSYVFHDKAQVRVPLNTALLAVQNMEASGSIVKDQQIEFNALSGSLSMMSKVLNDVLDFNKMDSGKFESASRPYAFHQVMRSLLVPLRLATDARNLTLTIELDPTIDIIARKAAYEALDEDLDSIRKHIEAHPNIDGVVTGDETRLRQVITNLASNACKFTPSGGKLTIRTKLILPVIPPDTDPLNPLPSFDEIQDDKPRYPLSVSHLSQHDTEQGLEDAEKEKTHSRASGGRSSSSPPDLIVVRIEVEDTGYGIKPGDMHKLFTAFNQTEQGRQQGGKGTGLGLALVRQIVKLSGGRLGLVSRVGRGSIFWVELPLGIGREAVVNHPLPYDAGLSLSQGSSHVDYEHGQTLRRAGVVNGSASAAAGSVARLKETGSGATRTNSALHGLMDQAGRFELVLKKHDDENQVPTRVIGDPSTGTQYCSPDLAQEDEDDVTVQDGSTAPTSSTAGTPNEASPMTTPQSENEPNGRVTTTLDSNSNSCSSTSNAPSTAPTVTHAGGGSGAGAGGPKAEGESRAEGSESRGESSPPTPVPGARRMIQRPTFVQLPSPRAFAIETHLPVCTPSALSSHSTTSTSPLALFDATHARGSPSSINAGMNFEPAAGMCVLVVDDDSLTRTLMKRILTRLGCHVSVAENGEVALEMILGRRISMPLLTPSSDYSKREAKPILEQEVTSQSTSASTPTGCVEEYKYAVVFLDNQMPVMSGLKVVAKLRQLGRKDFVVGVTGNALLTDQQEYLEAGVDRVLTKPVYERSLRDVLQFADERRKNISREAARAESASGDHSPAS